MEIHQPRRILILSPPSTNLAPVINTLVPPQKPIGDSKSPDPEPIHHIQTAYYSAKIPIWTDAVEDAMAWSKEWKAMDGAGDVVVAVGAWIVAFTKPVEEADLAATKILLKSIASVIAHHSSSSSYDDPSSADAVILAIALPQSVSPALELEPAAWDDLCQDSGGWEFIDAEAKRGLNEFGEKTGLPRLLEALQSGEWEGSGADNMDINIDDPDEMLEFPNDRDIEEAPPFALRAAEAGLSDPILDADARRMGIADRGDEDDEDGDKDVEALQQTFLRMQAAKDLGADVPAAERKKMAAKAVREVMREL